MNNFSKSLSLAALLILLTASCEDSKSIRVGDGETRNGPLTTANASITIGNECTVIGKIGSSNGDIINNDDCLDVHVILAENSKVLGEIKNAEVVDGDN